MLTDNSTTDYRSDLVLFPLSVFGFTFLWRDTENQYFSFYTLTLKFHFKFIPVKQPDEINVNK